MAAWKQGLIVIALAVAALAGWAWFDPSARDRLAAYGVPEALLPAPAETAGAAPGEAPAGQAAPGRQAGGGGGRPAAGGPGAGGPGGRGPGGPSPVTTGAATQAVTNDRVSAIGTAEADRTVTVFPRTAGMVDEILFRPGERVAAGAVLVRLDDDAERIAMERAQVTLADARAKAERYERLAANNSISSVERDAARSELASAELAIREARLALERREVKAPFAGVVGLTDVEVGDMVSGTTAIATVDDRSVLKVEFRIPEAYAARVALGDTASAVTPSRPGKTFEGTVSALGSRVEADSRTLVVQARLDNADDELRPGMSFLVTLQFSGDTRVAVPALAVQWDRDGSYVWRVAESKVSRVGVTILERTADMVLIDGELVVGDTVVVEGVQRLRPGATVADAGAAPAGIEAVPAGVPTSGTGATAAPARRS
ncbi:efflux RND transporter periplasmic adaptor subunit [Chthonobacter rhizosphaerae]|uniref:efflux RND transporter periplasmic adaptor subunit n=1 Tax=Chthonobacter rhizosphaerae TaxID=2735553 RepID=UPI0015EE3C00|nr:efflux RND transporter periplasmic adaptor subunit [Chthonobacter rhizosphaerae]